MLRCGGSAAVETDSKTSTCAEESGTGNILSPARRRMPENSAPRLPKIVHGSPRKIAELNSSEVTRILTD